MTMDAKTKVMGSHIKGQTPAATRRGRNEFSQEPLEETWTDETLISDFWAPECDRVSPYCFKLPS